MKFNQGRQAELSTITNLADRLGAMENTVSKIVQLLEAAQQHTEAPAAGAMKQKIDFGEIIGAVREAATAYKEVKTASSGDISELERYGLAFAEIARREALNAMKQNIRRGLRKGIVDIGTVESIIGEKIQAGGTHEPVL